MSAEFVLASNQAIVNAASPVTTFPITVGAWTYSPNLSQDMEIWSLTEPGTNSNYLKLGFENHVNFMIAAQAAGSQTITTFGNPAASTWFFVLARFISATNRRGACLNGNSNLIEHGNNSTSRNPTGLSTMALGRLEQLTPSEPLGGRIAEFWYTNTDVQADGAQINNDLMRQLAYGGPFSVPHVAAAVQEYRSLRSDPLGLGAPTENYAPGARQTWTLTNAPTAAPHPPLSSRFVPPPNAIIVPPWRRQARSHNVFATATAGFFSRYQYDMRGPLNV